MSENLRGDFFDSHCILMQLRTRPTKKLLFFLIAMSLYHRCIWYHWWHLITIQSTHRQIKQIVTELLALLKITLAKCKYKALRQEITRGHWTAHYLRRRD